MKISVLTSSVDHPIYTLLGKWAAKFSKNHSVELRCDHEKVSGGDFLFLISYGEYVPRKVREKYTYALVVHASDLPEGRGWSPYVWDLLGGKDRLVVTLLEAEDSVDCGDVWHKVNIPLEGHELYDEINDRLFAAELELMDYAIDNHEKINPVAQDSNIATYYEKRTPNDSLLDINKSIREQFNLLRVADPERYPTFFIHNGYAYKLVIEKIGKIENE